MHQITRAYIIEEKSFMDAITKQYGLRIADGVPTIFCGGVFEKFPANNERVFVLENVPDHPVYRNAL